MKIIVPFRGESNLQRSSWSWLQVYWRYSCWKDGKCIVCFNGVLSLRNKKSNWLFIVDPIWLVRNTYISHSLTHSLTHLSIKPVELHNIPPTCRLRGIFLQKKPQTLYSEHRKLSNKENGGKNTKKFEFAWLSFHRVKLSSHLQLLERTKRRGMTEIISKSSERYLQCILCTGLGVLCLGLGNGQSVCLRMHFWLTAVEISTDNYVMWRAHSPSHVVCCKLDFVLLLTNFRQNPAKIPDCFVVHFNL